MPEFVRMKALRPWRNMAFEGTVAIGQEFDAVEHRARDLELEELAVRVVAVTPMQKAAEVPPRPLAVTPASPATEPSSSSLLDPALDEKTSAPRARARRSSRSTSPGD